MTATSKPAFVDIETYSDIDLNSQGLHAYIHHPSFKILCGVIKHGTETSVFAKGGEDNLKQIRLKLNTLFHEGVDIYAWNSTFEMACLNFTPIKCLKVVSKSVGGAGSLSDASKMYLKEDLKDTDAWKDGLLCSGDYDEYKDKSFFKALVKYCEKDVILTEKIYDVMYKAIYG